MSDAESISKVTDIINDSHIGMFTTINEAGALVSRPLAVQEVKDDGDMWFFTSATTSQVAHIRANPAVNVSFGKRTEWVSVAGTAEVVTDRQLIHDMWNQVVEAWFPDGPDTPRWSCSTSTRTPPSTGPARAARRPPCCSGSSPR